MLDEINNGSDLVIGSRFLEESEGFKSTFLRRLGIRWLSAVIHLTTHVRVSDPTSGFRACGSKAIDLFCKKYPVDYPEPDSAVAAMVKGLRVTEVPVVMKERQGGKSSISGFSSIYYMIKVTLAIIISSFSELGRVVMHISLQFGVITACLVLLCFVLRLVLKDSLQLKYSLLWIVLALVLLVCGLFPQPLYFISSLFGFQTPANFVLS